jgi:DNA-binding HxlR family transcriptional regulator
MVTESADPAPGEAPSCSSEQLESAVRVLEGRWKVLIIYRLFTAPTLRFSELQRLIPGISQKMLIQQLRDLEANGIVSRTIHPVVPPRVDYALTEDGRGLLPALRELQTWAASRTTPA